jgi:hypothetical protein
MLVHESTQVNGDTDKAVFSTFAIFMNLFSFIACLFSERYEIELFSHA